jgi:hypothetical protein
LFPGNHILTEQTMHRKTSPAVFVFFALAVGLAFAATSPAVSAAKAGSANQGRRQEYMKVMEAARRDAPSFLELIPVGREGEFGFENQHEIAGAGIGNAYRVLTISPAFYRGESVPAGQELVEAGEWWVTIRNGARNALVLIVSPVEGKWQVVAMGMTNQAAELESFEKFKHVRKSKISILRMYPSQADFILLSSDGDAKSGRQGSTTVYPMMTARKAFPGMVEKSSFSLEELTQWLRIQYVRF